MCRKGGKMNMILRAHDQQGALTSLKKMLNHCLYLIKNKVIKHIYSYFPMYARNFNFIWANTFFVLNGAVRMSFCFFFFFLSIKHIFFFT